MIWNNELSSDSLRYRDASSRLRQSRRTVVFWSSAGLDPARRAAFRSTVAAEGLLSPHRGTIEARGAWGWLLCLIRRPDLVVVEGIGVTALVMSLYRLLSTRATFLVLLAEPPAQFRLVERLVLWLSDGVLVDGDAAALAMSGAASPSHPVARINCGAALAPFLRLDPGRVSRQTYGLIVVSDLTPGSGAADLLVSVSAWSEAHPDEQVVLSWIGQGDLIGLLAAQPLPDNLTQAFLGPIGLEQCADAFAAHDILVIPSIAKGMGAPVAEALAAGLPVLGSRRSREVRQHVTDGVNGWLFDPLAHGAMFEALSGALETSDRRLDDMRLRARASVTAPVSGDVLTRLMRQRGKRLAESADLSPAGQQAQ